MSISGFNDFDEIRNFLNETESNLLKNPDSLKRRVNQIGKNVLDKSLAAQDPETIRNFVNKISLLNEGYYKSFKDRPFNEILIKVNSALKKPKINTPIAKQPTETSEQKFRARLQALDLDHMDAPAKIDQLIADLKVLVASNVIDLKEAQFFEYILQTLKPPKWYVYTDLFFETFAFKLICDKSPVFKAALENAQINPLLLEQQAQRLMLKYLKNSDASLNELIAGIKKQIKSIQRELIKSKLGTIISKIPLEKQSMFGEAFIANFYRVMLAVEKFQLNIGIAVCEKFWEETLKVLDPRGEDKISTLLKHYSFLDPKEMKILILRFAQKQYFKTLTLEEICKLDLKGFKKKIAEMNKSAVKETEALYKELYFRYYADRHLWMSVNINAIKKPYNQGDQDSENMGEGICFTNSLERYRLLLDNPFKDGTTIHMGSSPEGRARQGAVNLAFTQGIKGELSAQEALAKQNGLAAKFDLKLVAKVEQARPRILSKAIVDQLDSLATSNFLGIITIKSPQGGHAFNIQIDRKNNIFRFIDDNMGVCEWTSYDDFRKQFSLYLDHFYSDYHSFALEQYASLKPS